MNIRHGDLFNAKMDNKEIRGRISIENNDVYLCQNKRDGADCSEKFGYKYSFYLTSLKRIEHELSHSYVVKDFIITSYRKHRIENTYKKYEAKKYKKRILIIILIMFIIFILDYIILSN